MGAVAEHLRLGVALAVSLLFLDGPHFTEHMPCARCSARSGERPWISPTRLMPWESPEQTDEGSVLAWSVRAGLPEGGRGSGKLGVGGSLEEVNSFSTYLLGSAVCRIETGLGDTGETEP